VEGVMYSETDSGLSDRLILSFGRRLRTAFYENVHAFAASVSLIDRRDLYERHADFCSRLAMTFSHGDYSRIEAVKEKEGTAERLYRKALEYFPDHRAFLGLGISQQKNRKYEESIKTLLRGVEYFPESEDLNICLGISYMNSGDYGAALSCFSKFPNSRQAGGLAAECRRGLGTVNR
jgi:anaerobic magnesium-protoporphyrin IX monomethyl ester cyclase